MPLHEHHSWSYLVRSGLQNLPDKVTVTRSVAVGDVDGYELAGELGVSHLAWEKGQLVTDQMAGVRFTRPLPILAPNNDSVEWSGWADSGDHRDPAKATVTHASTKLEVLGRPVETIRSDVDLKIADRKLQLSTWFEPGVGIVRQDQRTNGRLDITLELLGE